MQHNTRTVRACVCVCFLSVFADNKATKFKNKFTIVFSALHTLTFDFKRVYNSKTFTPAVCILCLFFFGSLMNDPCKLTQKFIAYNQASILFFIPHPDRLQKLAGKNDTIDY